MISDQIKFLQETLTQLRALEEQAGAHYHGVLVQLVSAARRETEMLLREEEQSQAWPRSSDEAYIAFR